MKINWFSPIAPLKTAIATYTRDMMVTLSRYADITIWVNQSKWDSSIERYVRVRPFKEPEWRIFNQGDINIYHIGNYADFHSWIWEISRRCPGVVVLHDMHLHHLFAGYYVRDLNDIAAYQNVLTEYFGNHAKGVIKKFCENLIGYDELNARFPITLHAVENALGIIVHSNEAYQTLKQLQVLPVLKASLPFPSQSLKNQISNFEKTNRYNIIIFGYIGDNRCLASSLQVLALSDIKNHFILNIYGAIRNEGYYRNLITKLNLENHVFLHGYVDENTLNKGLMNADLAINLRFPTMGEGSFSQLQIWSHKLPSVVTYAGWYATLPTGIIDFVRPGYEIDDLHAFLLSFLKDPTFFQKKGLQAAGYLEKHHSPDAYVNALLNFISETKNFRSTVVGLSLANVIKSLLTSSSEALAQEVATKIHAMFIDLATVLKSD